MAMRHQHCDHHWARSRLVDGRWSTSLLVPPDAINATCTDCGATLSLGPSNDDPVAVQHEVRAAGRLGQGADIWSYGPTFVGGVLLFTASAPDDWSWDISRPIAEQLAEPARVDAGALEVTITTLDRGNGPEPVASSFVSPGYAADVCVCACTGDALLSETCEVAP